MIVLIEYQVECIPYVQREGIICKYALLRFF